MIGLPDLLAALAHERPLFHSEADFQHALAWHLHLLQPTARVRLEYRPYTDKAVYLDLWIQTATRTLTLELKYFTRRLAVMVGGEAYALRDQGAQDIARYDFVKDLTRLERVVAAFPAISAYAILLTNDSSYWQPGQRATSMDAAFRVHEGTTLHGSLAWSPNIGAGTTHGREAAHLLRGRYTLHWAEYSQIAEGVKNGVFRYLIVPVTAPS